MYCTVTHQPRPHARAPTCPPPATPPNPQLPALDSTVGQPKAEVMSRRLLDINPHLNLVVRQVRARAACMRPYVWMCARAGGRIDLRSADLAMRRLIVPSLSPYLVLLPTPTSLHLCSHSYLPLCLQEFLVPDSAGLLLLDQVAAQLEDQWQRRQQRHGQQGQGQGQQGQEMDQGLDMPQEQGSTQGGSVFAPSSAHGPTPVVALDWVRASGLSEESCCSCYGCCVSFPAVVCFAD